MNSKKRLLNRFVSFPILILIFIYQKSISPFLGNNCRFVPSCSEYFKQSLSEHGLFYGSYLGIKRLLKCHPWAKSRVDPVPKNKN